MGQAQDSQVPGKEGPSVSFHVQGKQERLLEALGRCG